MNNIEFINGEKVPLEMHKVRVVQKLKLMPIEDRINAITIAGNNAHLLKNEDVFLDMLTDSGVNAMSDKQVAAMLEADDAYAGSASYYKLEEKIRKIFDMPYFLPAHQGRACEHLLSKVFIKQNDIVPMNYHFTTTKVHVELAGGKVEELITDEGLYVESEVAFKGDMDIIKLKQLVERGNIAFVRVEAGTNLIGGQPVSLRNMRGVSEICKKHGIKTVLDASLLSDNIYFNKIREEQCSNMSITEIILEISKCFDIIYFSARKLTSSRGGGMLFRNEEDYTKVRELIPVYEGFSTYGGISVREIESMAVGIDDLLDEDFVSQGPIFIAEITKLLKEVGVPVVTPAGGLGVHLNCEKFVPHIPKNQYPANSVMSALYIVSGIRGTERGTMSTDKNENGEEVFSKLELLRLALPRRVFTLSQIKYAVDRIIWLYKNSNLIGGLKFIEEPKVLRFFFGKLEPIGDWQQNLKQKFKQDFKNSL